MDARVLFGGSVGPSRAELRLRQGIRMSVTNHSSLNLLQQTRRMTFFCSLSSDL